MKTSIEVTGIEDIEAAMEQIVRRAKRMQPVMEEMGNYLENVIDKSFESGRAPDGEVWSPLADSTLIQKTKDGKPVSMGKLLYDEGTLRESIASEADSDSMAVGVNAYSKDGYPYPAVHQFGSEDGKTPARRFMPIDSDGELDGEVKEELLELLTDFFN